MFTVLSKTRNSNLYLIAALAAMTVILLTFAVVPAISAPRPALVPVTSLSAAGSDYYERHSELAVPGAIVIDATGDFSLRHPEWAANVQNVAVPVTGISETSDYFQRHLEVSAPMEFDRATLYQNYPGAWVSRAAGVAMPLDSSVGDVDYFQRHPELSAPAPSTDGSDYFLRH